MSDITGDGAGGNEAVNKVMERATIFAAENRHEYITVEHLLWSLMHDKSLQTVITEIGGRPNIIRNEVENYLNTNIGLIVPTTTLYDGPGHTTALSRVFQRALGQYVFAGRTDLSPQGLLLSIMNEEHSYAAYFVQKGGIRRDRLVDYLKKYDSHESQAELDEMLEEFCRNLNEESKGGTII